MKLFLCHSQTLRAMPVVDLETPTLCLVGAPNVGKSSLVRVLSTGKPEVCTKTLVTLIAPVLWASFSLENKASELNRLHQPSLFSEDLRFFSVDDSFSFRFATTHLQQEEF